MQMDYKFHNYYSKIRIALFLKYSQIKLVNLEFQPKKLNS